MNSTNFSDLLVDMQATYNRKNKDYGNSFDALFEKYDFLEPLLVLETKLNRLESLTMENAVKTLAIRIINKKIERLDKSEVLAHDNLKDLIDMLETHMGVSPEVVEESIEDTLKDLANYATMTRLALKK